MSDRVYVTEVGPRDGLQNENLIIPTPVKLAFIHGLVDAGIEQIELTSFVHPRWVPTMADAEEIFGALERKPGVRYLALVPNVRGYERARSAGCDAVALFTAASEAFTRKNINMTIAESLEIFAAVAKRAHADGVAVRGYVSTVYACPFAGKIEPEAVAEVVQCLFDLGCYEVSLGDTIGVATPAEVRRVVDVLGKRFPLDKLVMHFHDTWGMAVANVAQSVELGMRRFDSSAGGLGGCPYARSATGNVATEDLLYLLQHLGYDTGVDIDQVVAAAEGLARHLAHPLPSRVHKAWKGRVI
ncbi:MAG: hydroxymethylglutaryl-CoA lyase [Deltaproteobacteria bacterium]|nr:MAG: hydroxymethylglutaryl-CoA lyase [Deltaproteobacteria bacterium]